MTERFSIFHGFSWVLLMKLTVSLLKSIIRAQKYFSLIFLGNILSLTLRVEFRRSSTLKTWQHCQIHKDHMLIKSQEKKNVEAMKQIKAKWMMRVFHRLIQCGHDNLFLFSSVGNFGVGQSQKWSYRQMKLQSKILMEYAAGSNISGSFHNQFKSWRLYFR